MLKDRVNILINALLFLIILIGNFVLFRQDFIQTIPGSSPIYLIFGMESIFLLITFFRFSSRKIKLAVLSALLACIIGFIFEIVLFINMIGIFDLRIS